MIENYLAGMLMTDRARELLRKAIEGRGIALWERPEERSRRCPAFELLEGLRRGKRLGRRLSQEIYACYSELLKIGFSQDQALELTKSLIEGLAHYRRERSRPGLGRPS
jgi:hypothetical protein